MKEWLSRRGPNITTDIAIPTNSSTISLIGSVLHIQGDRCIPQPLTDPSGCAFLWNGEVFDGLEYPSDSSDTVAMFDFILKSLESLTLERDSNEKVVDVVQSCVGRVRGPYSFIFLDRTTNQIVFGRDPFGRRSLLLCKYLNNGQANVESEQNEDDSLVVSISSVSFPLLTLPPEIQKNLIWEEIKIGGIYSIPFTGDSFHLRFHAWPQHQLRLYREITNTSNHDESQVKEAVHNFKDILIRVLARRLDKFIDLRDISDKSSVGVLFSGGIDSLLLAVILHLTLPNRSQPIDLMNVAFIEDEKDFTSAPDRLSGIIAFLDLKRLFPTRPWRLVHVDVSTEERTLYEDRIKQLICPLETHMDLNIGTAFWFASRGKGYLRHYEHIQEEQLYSIMNTHGRPLIRIGEEGALRSKGVSLMATKGVETSSSQIGEKKDESEDRVENEEGRNEVEDLEEESEQMTDSRGKKKKKQSINCAHPKCKRVAKPGCPSSYCKRCCDLIYRQTMIDTIQDKTTINMKELLNPCPVHKSKSSKGNPLNLQIKNNNGDVVNITEEGEEDGGLSTIPAEFFLSEFFLSGEESIPYQTTCKILLVGLGADEQLAGYGRHRTVFMQGGNEALCKEINKDLARLWQRNLGRDDRCVSDHGREVWFPYLDEELVALIQSLPMSVVADLSLPQGVGDKMILRLTAQELGINGHLIQLVKRAIQFGTLAAKKTSVQYYGSRRKGKGESKI
eukprot:gene14446-15991_t